ncbi:MAG: tRNA 2-thiocytidine(32) synthetase TtcA [Deltaproteobacteria bacterium]|nr:tRNA 2-thiocytidine(32) synthetase TtcA [Deltaproteobacteria bacterium]
MSTYSYKAVKRNIGRALHKYDMISDGDNIAVGLSGGIDSLVLMWFLTERLKRIPINYQLFAVYIDPGFEGGFAKELEVYCREQGYKLRIDYSDCGIVGHSEENRENPCFLCSRLRRKRLFEIADELGCAKIALGHHKDDIIETLFMNMCYAGEISTMKPLQTFFNGKMMIIRPLSFIDKDSIEKFAEKKQLPVFHNPCPTSGTSKRHEIRTLLKELYQTNRKIKGNIFRSMNRVRTDYLLKHV